MSTTITIRDQSTVGENVDAITLEFLTDHITVRELIRERVYQEVKDYNASKDERFRGLVKPTDAERTLNGYKMKPRRMIDWKPQFEVACDAFERNQILVLIDDRQAQSLDDELMLTQRTEVTFLKLMPLSGG